MRVVWGWDESCRGDRHRTGASSASYRHNFVSFRQGHYLRLTHTLLLVLADLNNRFYFPFI